MIFIVLVCLVLLLPLLTNKFKDSKKTYCILVSIAFIIFAGFRSYMVGTDTPGYIRSFLNCEKFNLQFLWDILHKREFLFYIYESLICTITKNYTAFLMPIAIFYTTVVSYFIYKHSETPSIAYILFMSMGFFSFSMAGLRQTIAYAILILATEKIIKKKYPGSVLLILLASCFHITSLFYFVVFIIYVLPLNGWYIMVIGMVSAFGYMRGATLLTSVVKLVWKDERSYSNIEYGGTSTLVLLILVAGAALILFPDLIKRKETVLSFDITEEQTLKLSANKFFARLLLFAIPLQIMAIYQANIFRIAMMFDFYIICLIPAVINRQKQPDTRFVSRVIVAVFLFVQLFVFTYHSADIIPYTFFWQVR